MNVSEKESIDLGRLHTLDYASIIRTLDQLKADTAQDARRFDNAWRQINWLLDRRYPTGDKKRSSIIHLASQALENMFLGLPRLGRDGHSVLADVGSAPRLTP